jgi:hypothetical protein
MKTTTMRSRYRVDAQGRFLIASPELMAFGAAHPDRILDTELWGRPARVLMLDIPLQLGERIQGPERAEFRLRRIRLHEVPGWPPRMTSSAHVKSLPSLMECTLRAASFSSAGGAGQEAVEFVVEHGRKTHRAWLVGCPVPLLLSVEATVEREGLAGRKLEDVQDWRLVGPD